LSVNSVNSTYDAQDRILQSGSTSYQFTANGTLSEKRVGTAITRYIYDDFGQLASVTLPDGKFIEYSIDGHAQRAIKKVSGSITQKFIYHGDGTIAAELNEDNSIKSVFVYATQTNSPDYMITSGVQYKFVKDHLGSVRLVINTETGSIAQRRDYDEFGRVLTDTNPSLQPFGFAGGLYDSDTGLVRFGARDYDPETGRWTSKDPILFNGGQTNLYGYTFNDPINFIDPSGKFGLAGVASGFVSGMVGGYISGGTITAALAGGTAGAVVGFVNPWASSAAGAFAGGVASSLLGQVVGNVMTDQPYMNINLGAAAFSGFGSAVGVQAAGAMACGKTGSAIVEGSASGLSELFGGSLDQTRNFSPLFSPR
ncbi:MAG: RHS repeat-associated core domain-containing protein, partial [Pseudobdellovibrionaceae bacterium]